MSPSRAGAFFRRRPKMFRDLSALASGQMLSMVLGFVAFAYLARTLPPDSYGLIEYSVGLIGLAAIVIEGGMGNIGTLLVAREPAAAPRLAARIPVARAVLAAVVVPLVGASSGMVGVDGSVTTLLWIFSISLLALPFKQDWLLQGLERMHQVGVGLVMKSAAFAVGVLLVVRGAGDLLTVAVIEVIAAFAAAAYYVYAQRQAGIPLRWTWRVGDAWPLLQAGASIGANNMLWAFMLYAPLFFVTNSAGPREAAWLGGVQRIVASLIGFSGVYFLNLYPLMARTLVEDRARWARVIGASFRLIAWSSIGCAMAATVVADVLVVAAFGDAFLPAAPVFQLYIWLLPLRLLSGHSRWTLLAGERHAALLTVEALCAGVLVVFSMLLSPSYGAAGAAAAVVIANVAGWTAAHAASRRLVAAVPSAPQTLFPVASALAGLALASWAGGSAISRLGVALAVYGVCGAFIARRLWDDATRLAHAKHGA